MTNIATKNVTCPKVLSKCSITLHSRSMDRFFIFILFTTSIVADFSIETRG